MRNDSQINVTTTGIIFGENKKLGFQWEGRRERERVSSHTTLFLKPEKLFRK